LGKFDKLSPNAFAAIDLGEHEAPLYPPAFISMAARKSGGQAARHVRNSIP
jgi:hypothetical protein